MVRFIFICMAVVAVAILTTTAQFMINGIEDAREAVTARNTQQPDTAPVTQAATLTPAAMPSDTAMTAESLNAIDTAAGGNDEFKGGFSNVAPKGLEDDAPVALTPVPLNTLNNASE